MKRFDNMIIKKIILFISALLLLLGVSQSTAKEIIVSSERELIFTEKLTEDCHASTVLPLENGNVVDIVGFFLCACKPRGNNVPVFKRKNG